MKRTNCAKDNKNVNKKQILYKCSLVLSDISLDETNPYIIQGKKMELVKIKYYFKTHIF